LPAGEVNGNTVKFIIMANARKLLNYRKISLGLLALFVFYFLISQFKAVCENDKYPFTSEQRDPFSPLITETGQLLVRKVIGPSGLVLKGIIYSEDGSVAIIGDEVFKENDIINDYRIVKITRKKVILYKDGDMIVLKLEENDETVPDSEK